MTPNAALQLALHHLLPYEIRLRALLMQQAPLAQVLEAFVISCEAYYPGSMCAVLLIARGSDTLRHGVAPSLPAVYWQSLDGCPIAAGQGACAMAALSHNMTLANDIASDVMYEHRRSLALADGLRACWAVPVLSANDTVLGVFANYQRQPSLPRQEQIVWMQRATGLLGLLLEHHAVMQDLLVKQSALAESEARYRTLIETSPDAVAVHRNGLLLYVNPAAVALLRCHSAAELVGQSFMDFIHPDYRQLVAERALQAQQQRCSNPLVEEKLLRPDGSVVDVEVQSEPIIFDGKPAVYAVVRDLTLRRAHEEAIYNLAYYDPLTQLPNRRLLMDRLQQALVHTGQMAHYSALLLIDLDHFKQINDLLGHDQGDELLKQVARRLHNCVDAGDSVARVGGDEFMLLLETGTEVQEEAVRHIDSVAQRILVDLAATYILCAQTYNCTPSIGVVLFAPGEQSRTELVKKVDSAMYQAKADGRRAVRFFDPGIQAQVEARAEFEHDMLAGFEAREFMLHYQVQVDRQQQVIGVEALLRWDSAKRGMVPPSRFIPVAEENDLILPLGQCVISQACAQLACWSQLPECAHWTVAVNVSARQFAQSDFVESVANALTRTGVRPALLKLELTESMLVQDVRAVIEKMYAVRALGVRFSLDDFGTGYSSLSYLKQLPLTQLKIDQSFVHDLLTDSNEAVIARSIIGLGHNLGMQVIAEGVETAEQYQALADMGCDAFQGYFFGRPVPASQLPVQQVATIKNCF